MRLEKIIARNRIIDLRSVDLEGALQELLTVSVASFPDLKPDALLKGLLARESTMTTYLGLGVALPHVRVKMPRRYILAIGRSRAGIKHDGALAEERVHLIVMLIAGEKARDYLQVLASIARQVKEQSMVDGLVRAPDLDVFYERLVGGFGAVRPVLAQRNRVNRLMLREAMRVTRGADCNALMVFGDTFVGGIDRGAFDEKLKTILVTRNPIEPGELVFKPADGAIAQRHPRRPDPRGSEIHGPDLLSGWNEREQPVRHVGRGRHRARVSDSPDWPDCGSSTRRC
jgi:mannitol/fructose-specific phosphotransferase system IIA component (Ntr-type)